MFFFKRKDRPAGADGQVPAAAAAAILISVVALAVAIGVARWSWYIIDEQVRLRQDYMELKSDMDQVNTQYEFWLSQLQKERKAYLDQTNAPATK